MASWHLAQFNIARMRYPLDDSRMAGFVERLDELNALADAAPGFVWRLETEEGNATSLRPFPDGDLIINMSVWESVATLKDYVYKSAHVEPLRLRREWFEPFDGPVTAMWWIPAGHIPSVEEAKEKLAELRSRGPGPRAFDFRHPHDPPD